jgi:hypothetical protein
VALHLLGSHVQMLDLLVDLLFSQLQSLLQPRQLLVDGLRILSRTSFSKFLVLFARRDFLAKEKDCGAFLSPLCITALLFQSDMLIYDLGLP